jgi:hypothetical protein
VCKQYCCKLYFPSIQNVSKNHSMQMCLQRYMIVPCHMKLRSQNMSHTQWLWGSDRPDSVGWGRISEGRSLVLKEAAVLTSYWRRAGLGGFWTSSWKLPLFLPATETKHIRLDGGVLLAGLPPVGAAIVDTGPTESRRLPPPCCHRLVPGCASFIHGLSQMMQARGPDGAPSPHRVAPAD